MDMTKVKRYVSLAKEKEQIEKDLSRVRHEMNELEPLIRQDFLEDGCNSFNVDGRKVLLTRDINVKKADGADPGQIAAIVQGLNLPLPLSVNAATLKAWVKEQLYDDNTGEWEPDHIDRLPEELRGMFEVDEFHRLSCRKV